MKKQLTTLVLGLVFSGAFSQTNTFPASGNVGIGTSSPEQPLHININTDSKPGGIEVPSQAGLKLSRSGTANYAYPEAAEFRIGHGGSSVWGSKLDLYINGVANQNNIPDQHAMTWQYNGNVGIGTDQPTNTLTLRRSALGTSNDVGIDFSTTNGAYNPVYARIALGVTTAAQDQGTGYLAFSTLKSGTFSESVRIDPAGNLGVGTTDTKGYKLAVAGNMIAESVKVKLQGTWPDYVFLPSYKIPTLQEIEKHIKEKGHLPGIPSAIEVKANGVDLGDMNAKLLQKIEELTLHLIEIKKENASFKENLFKQQKEIKELKSKIK
ncbi:hypothetical protein [Pedobacter frigoris]|uniref:Uncharacterized protein n=1 Tax=Pedobacter frigoris TaxID=2571272 RepID=A0A4U1CDE5_9SPHI|nr:hypothetical protein [Pedobacter frigoris]TKC02815.1 hypothetical protein FA047_20125 [Pedobacter frigoris]